MIFHCLNNLQFIHSPSKGNLGCFEVLVISTCYKHPYRSLCVGINSYFIWIKAKEDDRRPEVVFAFVLATTMAVPFYVSTNFLANI